MIDTQALLILREIDRTGSVTLAADKLCLTQSAVSHAVRRFEERHGVQLWEREGRRLHLTETGKYLLGLANRVLPQLEHGAIVLDNYVRGHRGFLRIGMECHPCQDWLMRVVDPFLSQWPDVELDVTMAFQFSGLSALLEYQIDILVTPDPIDRSNIEYIPVFDYELVLAVAANHPLAKKDKVTPEDLADEILVTYPVARERLDIFTGFLLPCGVLPRRHRTIETTDFMLRLVAAGHVVSATPDWLVRNMTGVRGVKLGNGIHKSIHLGIRKGAQPNYLKSLITLAQTVKV